MRIRPLALGLIGFALTSCSGDPSGVQTVEEPVFTVSGASVGLDSVTISVAITNPADAPLTYELLAPCSTILRLYTMQGSEPAWDQLSWWNSQAGGCKSRPSTRTLAGGATINMRGIAAIADILGDSLAPTTYIAGVVVRLGFATGAAPELAAGPVDLGGSAP